MYVNLQPEKLEGLSSDALARAVMDKRGRALTYSVLTLLCPIAVFIVGVVVINALVDRSFIIALSGLPLAAPDTRVDATLGPLDDLAGRLRFVGPQALLIITGYVAIASAAWTTWSVFKAHAGIEKQLALWILSVFLLLGLYFLLTVLLLPAIDSHLQATCTQRAGACDWYKNNVFWPSRDIFGMTSVRDFYLYVIPEMLRRLNHPQADAINRAMETHGGYGGTIGMLAAAGLIAGAAVLAYRWRTSAQWFRPRVLRQQVSYLLFLFAVASALLVFANTGVRAIVDWPLNVLQALPDAPELQRLIDALRNTLAALSYWWGMMSAAILLATFIPAFASLLGDIDLAGRLALMQAGPDSSSEPTYGALKKWKEENGLTLSSGELTTALVAAAAPLLTSPVIDLSKTLMVTR